MVGEWDCSPLTQTTNTLAAMSTVIPVERLWELYECNPFTGTLYSKLTKKPRCGFFNNRRENLNVTYKGKSHCIGYGAAIYAWCVGEWAHPTVDHIDRNPRNHSLKNLRPAIHREQQHNRTSFNGGATYRPDRKKWFARITVQGKCHHLGTFPSKAEAQQAYSDALKALEAPCRGS